MHPVHIILHYFPKIQSNNILPSTPTETLFILIIWADCIIWDFYIAVKWTNFTLQDIHKNGILLQVDNFKASKILAVRTVNAYLSLRDLYNCFNYMIFMLLVELRWLVRCVLVNY